MLVVLLGMKTQQEDQSTVHSHSLDVSAQVAKLAHSTHQGEVAVVCFVLALKGIEGIDCRKLVEKVLDD